MITVTVKLDDQYYQGVDTGQTAAPAPGLSNGWHNYQFDDVELLKLGTDNPKVIEGRRNLRSTLDKILSEIESGRVQPRTIVIQIQY